MSSLPLAGPSSPLRTNAAEVRRCVNWIPVRIESGTGKGGATTYLKQLAGLTLLGNFGAAIRGLKVTQGRLFAVSDAQLLEIDSSWTSTALGPVGSGDIELDANKTQLAIVNGSDLVVLDLSLNTTSTNPANWRGSASISVLDGYGVFVAPRTNQFYISASQDFTTFDALDFASAEATTGDIIGTLTKHQEVLIIKELGAEVWDDNPDADFALSRNESAIIEVGLAARATLRKVASTAIWLGQDEEGNGIVFAMSGYVPQRISSQALEEKLAGVADLSQARAWTYHQEGLSYYVLNVPGLDTTWCYEVSSGIWDERGEWVDGAWAPWRATCHALAFGQHVVGDAAGNLYRLDPLVSSNAGDPLVRDWISPHDAAPGLEVQRFGSFEVVGDVGLGLADTTSPNMLLRWSNDGGQTWGDWSELPLGAAGEVAKHIRATQLGSARDRVWNFRVTDDVRCNVVAALVNEK